MPSSVLTCRFRGAAIRLWTMRQGLWSKVRRLVLCVANTPSDVLTRHRRKCLGPKHGASASAAAAAAESRRSVSPYSSSSRRRSESLNGSHPLALNVQDDGRLPLLRCTSGGNGRRRKGADTASSAGSDDVVDGTTAATGADGSRKTPRPAPPGMPILDIDFPPNVALPDPRASGNDPYSLGWDGLDDFPLDSLVGEIESFLPDTTFDFEAFFSASADPTRSGPAAVAAAAKTSPENELAARIGPPLPTSSYI